MTLAHTTCRPASCGPVQQYPSRKKPVRGATPQSSRGPPRTFRSPARRAPAAPPPPMPPPAPAPAAAPARAPAGLYLESDCDEQVLLSIPFNQVVKLRALELRAPGDGTGPRRLKIFTNSPHMGLDEAESAKPVEAFDLGPEHRNGSKLLDLYFVKYQNVRSLQVFVESNEGGDELTRVSKLTVLGTPEHTTNMSDFKKSG